MLVTLVFVLFGAHSSWALSGISVIKYNVSYGYLLTRTIVAAPSMDTIIDFNEFLSSRCGSQICIAAFYDNSTKYQLFIDVQNNCTSSPNCLGFNQSDYSYSLVYMNTSTYGCSTESARTLLLDELTKMPKCNGGWYTWIRPNGRIWCYMISSSPIGTTATWNKTNDWCATYNATLNAFQTVDERTLFIARMIGKNLTNPYVYLGAARPCATSACPITIPFEWIPGTSTDNSLANDIFYTKYLDGTGNCLAVMSDAGKYDDISCSQLTAFSCGKWADIYS